MNGAPAPAGCLRHAARAVRCCCLLLALATAGCRQPPPVPLRVAANPWPGYEFLFLAETRGYFVDEGLEVRLVETLSLADTRRAFERNHVDVFAGTVVEALLGAEYSGRSTRIFHVCDYSVGADVILARPPLDSVAALKGMRIGVEPASVNVALLQSALRKNGMRMADVVVVPLSQNAMPGAVARGAVDAAVCYPPVSVQLLAAGMRPVFDSASVPGEIVDVLCADADVLEARAGDIAALKRAYGRAQRFAEEHPDEAHAIMARREGIGAAEFRAALLQIRVVRFDGQAEALASGGPVENAVRLTAEGLRSVGILSGDYPPSLMIDRDTISRARGRPDRP